MTTDDVSLALFERVREQFDDDQIVELTEVIAWENASARFNRALRIGSQHLWSGSPPDQSDLPCRSRISVLTCQTLVMSSPARTRHTFETRDGRMT